MSTTVWAPNPEKDFNAAKRDYVEQFGSVLVTNTYLKVALLALCAVILGLAALDVKIYQSARHMKPLIIRINEVGRAEALQYDSFDYRPREAEIKFFLMDFVQRHYGRMRATVRENYARSLYFLDGRLADAAIEANKKSNSIETFLNGSDDEIEIQINSVSIEDLRTPPYRATVDFEKLYYSAAYHQETKREKYIANFVFVVKDEVPNPLIPVNPLGLTITYFREDQAFR
jgi:type IV secretion system protein VirB5